MTGPLTAAQWNRLVERRLHRLEGRPAPVPMAPPLYGGTPDRPDPSTVPTGSTFFDTDVGAPFFSDGSTWTESQAPAIPLSGDTASRPADPLLPVGTVFFDTTLKKPVWFTGTTAQWVDATGTVV